MAANPSSCHPGDSSKELKRLPQLAESLRQFDLPAELRLLRQEDSCQPDGTEFHMKKGLADVFSFVLETGIWGVA